MRSRSSLAGPGRAPSSRSACRTQLRSVSPLHPILAAIDWIADHWLPCASRCSRTIRTARSRTSGAKGFTVLLVSMTSASQELRPPANAGRYMDLHEAYLTGRCIPAEQGT